jgi:hypothetical protein
MLSITLMLVNIFWSEKGFPYLKATKALDLLFLKIAKDACSAKNLKEWLWGD